MSKMQEEQRKITELQTQLVQRMLAEVDMRAETEKFMEHMNRLHERHAALNEQSNPSHQEMEELAEELSAEAFRVQFELLKQLNVAAYTIGCLVKAACSAHNNDQIYHNFRRQAAIGNIIKASATGVIEEIEKDITSILTSLNNGDYNV